MKDGELKKTLENHKKWLLDRKKGKRADLREANLREANLSNANLREADLYRANLSRANLSRANLYRANLREADLREADLSGVDLYRANLSGATFNETRGTKYAQCSFDSHGEAGRLITLVLIGEDLRFFCGCFEGTPDELEEHIRAGDQRLRKTRTFAMEFLLEAIKIKNEK